MHTLRSLVAFPLVLSITIVLAACSSSSTQTPTDAGPVSDASVADSDGSVADSRNGTLFAKAPIVPQKRA